MKTIASAPLLLALLLIPACGTRGGVNSQANVSAGALPAVGPAVDTAAAIVGEVDRTLGKVALDVATAPFRASEGELGLDPAQVRSTENLNGRYSPDERLARRRAARGSRTRQTKRAI